MKVEINLNNDTLIAVDSLLKKIYDAPISADKETKIMLSIMYALADKFSSKVKLNIRNATLFNNKKTSKFTLKYYEAWALHECLMFMISHCDTAYRKTLIQTLINKLNQKLA